MKFRVERKIDGEWYYWGTYSTPAELGRCMWELGHSDSADAIRITEVKES